MKTTYYCAECGQYQTGEPYLWIRTPLCRDCYRVKQRRRRREWILGVICYAPAILYLLWTLTDNISVLTVLPLPPLIALGEWLYRRLL